MRFRVGVGLGVGIMWACLQGWGAVGSSEPAGKQISTNGLAYWVSGSGPTVVLLHGSNLDHRIWEAEVRLLEPHYRVIRYDLRGHGESAMPEAPFLASQDLIELLEHLGEKSVTLVGHSAGGQIALDLALEAPDLVDAMVLLAPGVGGYRPKEMPAFLQDLIVALQAGDFDRANQILLDTPLFEVPEQYRGLVVSMVQSNRRLWTIPPNFLLVANPPALLRLDELKMPILVLIGDQDLSYLRELAQLIVEGAVNARLEVIPGGKHLLNLSSPEAFHARLLEFVAKW